MYDFGLLILRVVLGLVFVGHGSQKLFGWFGGGGLKGTAGWIGKMGFRPAWFWGLMAGLTEFGGGTLLLLGLFSPLGSLGIIAPMLIAIWKVHWAKGFWNGKGGIEFPLVNLTAALALGLTGPGAYAVDSVINAKLPEPASLLVGLAVVTLGTIVALVSEAVASGRAQETANRGS
jgi:putative oxidoreductase